MSCYELVCDWNFYRIVLSTMACDGDYPSVIDQLTFYYIPTASLYNNNSDYVNAFFRFILGGKSLDSWGCLSVQCPGAA